MILLWLVVAIVYLQAQTRSSTFSETMIIPFILITYNDAHVNGKYRFVVCSVRRIVHEMKAFYRNRNISDVHLVII